MSDFDMKALEGKIEKSKSMLKEDLSTVRAGRANAALVDKVMVEYYGTPTPLKALANISVPEPRTLLISPFDPKSIPEIEKGINIANIETHCPRCGAALYVGQRYCDRCGEKIAKE